MGLEPCTFCMGTRGYPQRASADYGNDGLALVGRSGWQSKGASGRRGRLGDRLQLAQLGAANAAPFQTNPVKLESAERAIGAGG